MKKQSDFCQIVLNSGAGACCSSNFAFIQTHHFMVVSSHRESHIRLQHSKFVQELDAMFLLPLVVHL